MSDDLPPGFIRPGVHDMVHREPPALGVPVTVQQVVDYVAAKALEQVKEAHHAELADLRSRIESLERAHGLIPGTSMENE